MTIDDVITMLNSEDCMLAIAGMCLMRYKERDCWKCILKQYSKTVYNKAIDDVAGRLKEMANNSSTKYIRLSEKETITTYGVEQIAEQLKAGGENERSI